jgi:Trk K+ transport system NAD-binding subunit
VCGADHLGIRVVQELQLRDETVVAVAPAGDDRYELERLGVRVVVGDQRHERVLREAGVGQAAAIVLTADSDLANVHAALAAHELNPTIRMVIRLFDAELGAHLPTLFPTATALSSSALAAPGFVSAALDGEGGGVFEVDGRVFTVRHTGRVALRDRGGAAPELGDVLATVPIARILPDRTVEILPDATGKEDGLVVVDARAATASPSDSGHRHRAAMTAGPWWRRVLPSPRQVRAGVTSPDRRLINLATVVLILAAISAAYFQATAGFSPIDALTYAFSLLTGAGGGLATVDVTTAPGTLKLYAILLSLCGAAIIGVVYALITDAIIGSRLLRTLGRRPVPASIRDHVIVCGLGAVGYRVARGIVDRGVRVVATEIKEGGRFVGAARSLGIPVVIGDARQPEVLDELGIRTARAVVCGTNDDLVNLEAALNARAVRPDIRVVVRVFDPDFAVRVQRGFGIRFTRSVSHLAAPAFAAAAMGSDVIATVPVGDRRVVVFARVRLHAGSALDGSRVGDVDATGERRILGTVGPDASPARWEPDPNAVLAPGTDLVVAATRAGLAALLDRARPPADEPAAPVAQAAAVAG